MSQNVAAYRGRASQRGLSLVELMVGITVGLFVVAAAAGLVANQLGDNRRLLLETQVQQDLRASMDIITRQLRRAGAGEPQHVQGGIAVAAAGGASSSYADISPAEAPASATEFVYYLDGQKGSFGFKLEDRAIKSWMKQPLGSSSQWQQLTDPATLNVTSFSVTPRTVSSTVLPCPKLCPIDVSLDPTGIRQYCWPQMVVRSYIVDIQAEAKSDPGIRRGLRNEVRVRNDIVDFNGATVCPS